MKDVAVIEKGTASPRPDAARAPFYNPAITYSMRSEIKRMCVRLGTLNFGSNYCRQLLDTMLTELGVEHNDIFSYTNDECKVYVKNISWRMQFAPRSAVENCHDILNTYGYHLAS